jgi:hypothetical protein
VLNNPHTVHCEEDAIGADDATAAATGKAAAAGKNKVAHYELQCNAADDKLLYLLALLRLNLVPRKVRESPLLALHDE